MHRVANPFFAPDRPISWISVFRIRQPEAPIDAEELRGYLAEDMAVQRNPAARFAFIRQGEGVVLFVNGQAHACAGEAAALAERLCAQPRLTVNSVWAASDAAIGLLVTLFNQGSVGFDDEEEGVV